jgi:hypothetical protein
MESVSVLEIVGRHPFLFVGADHTLVEQALLSVAGYHYAFFDGCSVGGELIQPKICLGFGFRVTGQTMLVDNALHLLAECSLSGWFILREAGSMADQPEKDREDHYHESSTCGQLVIVHYWAT